MEIISRIILEQGLGPDYWSDGNQMMESYSAVIKFHKLFSHCLSSNVTADLFVCHCCDIHTAQSGHGTVFWKHFVT